MVSVDLITIIDVSGGFTAIQIQIAHDMAIRIIPDVIGGIMPIYTLQYPSNTYNSAMRYFKDFRQIHQYKETDTSGVGKAA